MRKRILNAICDFFYFFFIFFKLRASEETLVIRDAEYTQILLTF